MKDFSKKKLHNHVAYSLLSELLFKMCTDSQTHTHSPKGLLGTPY